jgi:hypothetical protein
MEMSCEVFPDYIKVSPNTPLAGVEKTLFLFPRKVYNSLPGVKLDFL